MWVFGQQVDEGQESGGRQLDAEARDYHRDQAPAVVVMR